MAALLDVQDALNASASASATATRLIAAAVEARLVSPGEAVLWGLFLTLFFIAGFFVLKENPRLTNDDPQIIRQRILYVAFMCVISAILLHYFLDLRTVLHFQPFASWLGLRWDGLAVASVLPLLQLVILFVGPLTMAFFDEELPFQRHFSWSQDAAHAFGTLLGFRNHVAVNH